MGFLAPGAHHIADYFVKMAKYIEKNAEEFDFLGQSNWVSSERAAGNELLTIMYFRSVEGLHKFAHHDVHRQGWNWWNKNIKDMPHQSIWHEVFVAPKGNWESIYVNSQPILLGMCSRHDHSGARDYHRVAWGGLD